ncbi:acyltransferase [Streptomyces sp. NPDC051940]|uniref:acyltransferase family protein n=1 Tax=Streptomyces sp. NPDC051940 TaxID=3155675 RepID=UPI00341FF919
MSGAGAAGRDRLPSLTGLRFWAALLVVLYHLSRQVGTLPWISDAAWFGRSGVTFFFVLSGFVLAWTYDGAVVPARVFFWRRFARIWPLLALSVVLSVAVWVWMDRDVSGTAITATLLMVHAWSPDPVVFTGGNPAAWSLSDEAWFYLLFPILLASLAPRRARTWAWTAAAVCVAAAGVWMAGALFTSPTTRSWALDYLPLTRTLQFVLGVCAGLAVKRGWRPRLPLYAAALLVLGWHLVLIPWSHAVPGPEWYSPYSASQLLSAPVFAALICTAATADLQRRRTLLGGPWMIRLGHWSFAWYLIHEVVIRAVVHVSGKPVSGYATAGHWLLIVAVSLTAAGLAYEYVERPLERWLRKAGPSLRTATPSPAAAGEGVNPRLGQGASPSSSS